METVIFQQTAADYSVVGDDIRRLIEGLGGMGRFVRKGERILIKPNLLAPTTPEQAVVTHPAVFETVAHLVIDAGGIPLVGDSPPGRSLTKLMEKTGHLAVARKLGVEVCEFRESVKVDIAGPFRNLFVSKEAASADGIINLPKLKTHGQMGMTLAVKNLFGCIVGMKKPEWHFRAGVDADLFASVIVGVYTALRPRLNLVDGVLAMEGNGPGTGGTPRKLGWLVAGTDATAVDWAICTTLGINPEDVPTIRFAQKIDVQQKPAVEGPVGRPRHFRLPGEKHVIFGPRRLHRFFRKRFTARPRSLSKQCVGCKECLKYCPAQAMSLQKPSGPVLIDYDQCIRCYCCLEVCPHGAMEVRGGWLRRR